MNNNTIDGSLLFAQNAISNALNQPQVAEPLAEFGYDATKINEGKVLLDKALDLQTKQKKEYGEQYTATFELNEAKATANKEYMKHLKIARIALGKDPGAANALQLMGDRARSFSGWLSQANAFYTNALATPKIMDALGVFGITAQKLTDGQALVNNSEAKYNSQLKEKGEAQTATKLRDEAIDALDTWMSAFVGIARIALEDNPQYLEMLGIVAPS